MKNTKNRDQHNLLSRWVLFHWRAIHNAFTDMRRSLLNNLITIFVIGIAIALPLGFFVMLENIQHVNNAWGATTPTLSLYLKTDVPDTRLDVIMQGLQKNPDIKKIVYVSPEEGLKNFKR